VQEEKCRVQEEKCGVQEETALERSKLMEYIGRQGCFFLDPH